MKKLLSELDVTCAALYKNKKIIIWPSYPHTLFFKFYKL